MCQWHQIDYVSPLHPEEKEVEASSAVPTSSFLETEMKLIPSPRKLLLLETMIYNHLIKTFNI